MKRDRLDNLPEKESGFLKIEVKNPINKELSGSEQLRKWIKDFERAIKMINAGLL